MLTVAYLANQFPSAVEPYVSREIEELRRRGVTVIPGSVRKAADHNSAFLGEICGSTIVLQRMGPLLLLRGLWLCLSRPKCIRDLGFRILFKGTEGPLQRVKALIHTWLGACYSLLLQEHGVDHIHAHHGYFGSWIAMVAARFLGVSFSMTLHGSDLLLQRTYLDLKLATCAFCLTISDYNRCFLLDRYPEVDAEKILVSRLGVELSEKDCAPNNRDQTSALRLLSVGRLHRVKDHAFLIKACAELREEGVEFECSIAGDGPERHRLEALIHKFSLEDRVTLLGHIDPQQIDSLYHRADVVVLTSQSEGIPLVLMEAMARAKIVLAPAITGIPELVTHGKTGFLYEPDSLEDFVAQLHAILYLIKAARPDSGRRGLNATHDIDWIRHAARMQIWLNFNREKNLENFSDLFLSRITSHTESIANEDFVLQQI